MNIDCYFDNSTQFSWVFTDATIAPHANSLTSYVLMNVGGHQSYASAYVIGPSIDFSDYEPPED